MSAPEAPPASNRRPDGRFRNPWPNGAQAGLGALLRWVIVERLLLGRGRDRTPAG